VSSADSRAVLMAHRVCRAANDPHQRAPRGVEHSGINVTHRWPQPPRKEKAVQPYETNTRVRGASFCRAIGTSVAGNFNRGEQQRSTLAATRAKKRFVCDLTIGRSRRPSGDHRGWDVRFV